ncbi:MAG: ABC transporter permease [Streptococcus sobrinus]
MKALLKIEWIKTWREWPYFIMAIGMPVGFFIFFSGMKMSANPASQKLIVQSIMLTMTGFSMSSFGLFSFPFMLAEDRSNHWLTYIEHSKVPIYQYYLSKVLRVIFCFFLTISITFLIGAFYRHISLSWGAWLGSAGLLLASGVVFFSFGLLLAQIKSQQTMSIVANIAFLGMAMLGGSWWPISNFPDWVQKISKLTPVYHVNQLSTRFAANGQIRWTSLLIILAYAIIMAGLALLIKRKTEVN